MSSMNAEGIDAKNVSTYINFVNKYWGYDAPSMEFIKNRLVTDQFDPEYAKLLTGSKDQRVRWDIDFTEPALANYYSERDDAYKMFSRKFIHAISLLKDQGVNIDYTAFMKNKVLYKKNETKLKKVFEVVYAENTAHFCADASIRNKSDATKETIEKYIVTSFEEIGVIKRPSKKLQLVLSLNLCDWLLCSTSGDFSSCLNLEGGNKFWMGHPNLAGDPNRAFVYITDGRRKTYEGFEIDNAISRSWVILTNDNRKSIIRWYPNEVLNADSIANITGDTSWKMGMSSNGKNEITPIRLNSGLITTIYMDAGCWEPNVTKTKFLHTMTKKGCYQTFCEDLTEISEIKFSQPFGGNGIEWKISFLKREGIAIDDCVPVARCKSCGSKKMKSRNSGASICYSCFNREYYTCLTCGNARELKEAHYDGYVVNRDVKVKAKIDNDCLRQMKTCECCGLPIRDGSNKTAEGGYVCNICVKDKTNGYRKCNVCGKVSKSKVIAVYNHETKAMNEYCSEHLPKPNDDIEKNGSSNIAFTRKPYTLVECKVCHARLPKEALIGNKTCNSCAATGKGVETLEV